VNNVLHEYLDIFTIAYLDDILVFSRNKEEHVGHVKKVLGALQEAGLLVKPEKCEFHKDSVEFLGFILTLEGIKMDKKKVAAIVEWPTPTNVTEVQSFLGFANFYRRFIKGYSMIVGPLTTLTKKDHPFEWTDAAEKAFQKLKNAFTSEPILRTFDPERPIILETDASDYAIGACLSQPDEDKKLHPIAFYSRKMAPAELNYEIHDKELLAVVMAFKEWRVYLEGPKHKVKVYTDHKNLLYFTTTKKLNRRQARWAEELANYNFEILYTKGSENVKADALSRRADYLENKTDVSHAIFEQTEKALTYNRPQLAATMTITPTELVKEIRAAYEKDAYAKRVANAEVDEASTGLDGLIRFQGYIYIPQRMTEKFIKEQHALPAHGHQGPAKTAERISRDYYFPRLRQRVKEVLANCDTCIRNKTSRHAPYGQLKSPDTPTRAWESIAWDFVVKLPKSKEPMTEVVYDSIFVTVDRLTKYVHLIPYLEASSAEELAYIFVKVIVANHGLPKEIISDRDTLFTSKFFTSLMARLGTKQKMSTAFHPRTDGQTERMNQTIEAILRCYVNYKQNNWVELLPVAQFAVNSAMAETTQVSPFYANYGFDPVASLPPRENESPAQAAILMVDEINGLQEQLALDIKFINERSAHYYNQRRSVEPTLKEGDKVYLLRRNIKTKRPSDKLDHKKLGPFKIKKKIGPVNYELELPRTMRIHPVFHIALLEPAPEGAPEAPRTEISPEFQNAEYEVEQILDCKLVRGKKKYLVKWLGYTDAENTWEPLENFSDPEQVREFHRQNPDPPRKKEARPLGNRQKWRKSR
jgi:hypothetical protein